jgi:hypothetical protein
LTFSLLYLFPRFMVQTLNHCWIIHCLMKYQLTNCLEPYIYIIL